MACRTVSSIEEAEEQIPASLFPVYGLRRGANGALTLDAIRTVVDGIKSRGIDPKDPGTKREIIRQLEVLFCSVNNQYQFLVQDMFMYLDEGQPVPARRLDKTREKNQYLLDLLSILRHIQAMGVNDESSSFIEAWQNPPQGVTGLTPTQTDLLNDQALLESKRIYEMKMQRVIVTEEKNKVATNYIGLYGFLNLIAVGLLIYSTQKGDANNE